MEPRLFIVACAVIVLWTIDFVTVLFLFFLIENLRLYVLYSLLTQLLLLAMLWGLFPLDAPSGFDAVAWRSRRCA